MFIMKIKQVSQISWLFYSLNAIVIPLYFSYIDEGSNSFNWIQNPADWVGLILYVLAILLGQLFVEQKLFSNRKYKILLSMLVGTILGFIVLFLMYLLIYLVFA